jgi:hypothetical protein
MAGSPLIVRLLAVLAAATLSLLAQGPDAAAAGGGLFEVTVPVTADGRQAAFRTAMADVLVKVTGRRDAAQLPGLVPLVDDASRYVTSYRRAAGGRLAISFDGEAIESAVAEAGLPFWGAFRPVTLVWLAVDRGGQHGLVTAEAYSSEKSEVEAAADLRGLPLAWPSSAAGEDARLRLEQVWSGDVGSLTPAASRYGADGVLVGRAVAGPGGDYSVDWTFVGAGGSAALRGALGDGVNLVADRYASLYASPAAAQRSEIDVTIAGVTSAAQYADVARHLASLSTVRAISLRRVLPDAVVFRVSIRGGLYTLQREAGAAGRLRPVADTQGAAVFTYQP